MSSPLTTPSRRTALNARPETSKRRGPLEALGGLLRRKPAAADAVAVGPANELPEVRVAPALQAEFYAALELVVATTTNLFLVDSAERLDANAVQREVKAWESGVWALYDGTKAKRAPVSGFLYPLDVQARLLEAHQGLFAHIRTSSSGGDPSIQHWNACAVADTLAGWGHVVASLSYSGLGRGSSSRSLCMPDWLVAEHLCATERLLGLFIPGRHFNEGARARWIAVSRRVRDAMLLDSSVRTLSYGGELGVVAPPAPPAPALLRRHSRESYMEGW